MCSPSNGERFCSTKPWREGAGTARGCAIKSSIFWQSEPEDDLKGSGTFVHLTHRTPDGNSQLTVNHSDLAGGVSRVWSREP